MFKFVSLLFVILFFGFVLSQTVPPFFETKTVYNFNYGVSKFQQVQLTKNGATLINQRQAITYQIPTAITNSTSPTLLNGNVVNITNTKDTFSASSTINDLVYAIGSKSIYLIDPSTNTFSNASHSYSSIKYSFTFNNNVYILTSSSSNQIIYFKHDPNYINSPSFTPQFQTISLQGSFTFWSFAQVVDFVNGYLFIGDYSGNVVSFNLNNNQQLNSYSNSTFGQRVTSTINTENKLIYFIGGGLMSTKVDVLSYANIAQGNLTWVATYTVQGFGSSLQGAYDSSIGQVFFTGSEKNEYNLGLLAIGSNGNTQTVYNFNSSRTTIETSSIGIYIQKSQSLQLSVFTGDEVIVMTYDTGCPSDCNGRGQCFSGVCQCNYDFGGNACELLLCGKLNNCSGNGVCNTTDGTCQCQGLWMGNPSCSQLSCYMNCYGHGQCNTTDLTCACEEGYQGVHCQYPSTPTPTTIPNVTVTPSINPTSTPTANPNVTVTPSVSPTPTTSENSTSTTGNNDNSSVSLKVNLSLLLFTVTFVCVMLSSSNPNDLINLLS